MFSKACIPDAKCATMTSNLYYIPDELTPVLEPGIKFLLHRNFLGLSTPIDVASFGMQQQLFYRTNT